MTDMPKWVLEASEEMRKLVEGLGITPLPPPPELIPEWEQTHRTTDGRFTFTKVFGRTPDGRNAYSTKILVVASSDVEAMKALQRITPQLPTPAGFRIVHSVQFTTAVQPTVFNNAARLEMIEVEDSSTPVSRFLSRKV